MYQALSGSCLCGAKHEGTRMCAQQSKDNEKKKLIIDILAVVILILNP